MNQPALPQELQDEIVRGNSDDIVTLRETSLVNAAWRETTYRYLFSSLNIRATACRPVVATLDDFANIIFRDFLPDENPSRTFRRILTLLPHSFDAKVKSLALKAASLEDRMKNAAVGIQVVKPELDACTVRAYLERFPQLESLEIEDVEWVDCPDTKPDAASHCNCIQLYPPRPFSRLALRRITHRGTSSNATLLTQAASTLDDFVVDSVIYEDCDRPPYPMVPVKSFTLGISRQPWGAVKPDLGCSNLTSLRLLFVSSGEIEWVRQIVLAHCNTLEEFSIRVWCSTGRTLFIRASLLLTDQSADSSFWADLGLSQCTSLHAVGLFYTAHATSVRSRLVSLEILLNLVGQLPPCVRTLCLAFQTQSSCVTSAATLLSTADWEALAAECRQVAELSTIEIAVQLEDGGKPPTVAQKAKVHSEIDMVFNDGGGTYRFLGIDTPLTTFTDPKMDIILQWENRSPQAETYDSDFEG